MFDDLIAPIINQIAQTTANRIEHLNKMSLSKLKSNTKAIYNEQEAAEFLGISKDKLQRYRRAGQICFIKYPSPEKKKQGEDAELEAEIVIKEKAERNGDYSYFLPDLLNFAVQFRHQPIKTREVYKFGKVIDAIGLELEK